MIPVVDNISDLLVRLNHLIKEELFDSEGYIIPETLREILNRNSNVKEILLKFINDEKFNIKYDNLENYLFSLDVLTKLFNQETIVLRTRLNDKKLLKAQLLEQDTRDLESFFKTIPEGFIILIELLKTLRNNNALINFLLRFKELNSFLYKDTLSCTIKKIKEYLTPLVEKEDPLIFSQLKDYLKINQVHFPILSKKVNSTFVVNKYITLKLENRISNIYVAGRKFNQCKYLFLNVTSKNADYYKYVESIDEAAEVSRLNNALEGNRNNSKYSITPETEFWGHCSNIQAWVENEYDTRILHRNLAFPLLKRLTEVGDPKARKVFKSEILNRLISGHHSVISYLTSNGYLRFLSAEDYGMFFSQIDLTSLERLFKGLGHHRHYSHVKKIFDRLLITSPSIIEELIIDIIKIVDLELFQGLRRSKCLDLINQSKLLELLREENCRLNEFCYEFKEELFFIQYDLSLRLSKKGLKSFKEIVGLHRLKNLKILDVSNNELEEIIGLENLTNLKTLKIGGNPIPEPLIRELGGLDNKGYAKFPLNFIKYCKEHARCDVNAVILHSVRYEVFNGKLDLSNKDITNLRDLKGIEKLKDLKSLNLSNNILTNIDGIEKLKSLQNLNLCNNRLDNIKGVEKLKNLQILRLHGNVNLKVPDLSQLNRLNILDVTSSRKLDAKVYLNYLLQLYTINELNGLYSRFSLQKSPDLSREGLIRLLCEKLEDYSIRDIIRENERRIISIGLKEAIFNIQKLQGKQNKDKLHFKLIHDNLIEAIYNHGKSSEFHSILDLHRKDINDPIRICDCRIGKNKGLCSHFWTCLIFAFKMNLMKRQEWNLTSLPRNFEEIIEPFEIEPISSEKFCLFNNSNKLATKTKNLGKTRITSKAT